MNFVSKYGYIKPNSWDLQSENGLLFTIQYHFLLRDSGNLSSDFWFFEKVAGLIELNYKSNNGDFRTLPHDNNPRFSLDNMCAVAGFCRRYNYQNGLDHLPLFRHYSLRPDNFAYLLYCKYPLAGIWFLWITSLFMIISCMRAAPDRTSGPLLCYVKARGANMKLTWWICKKVNPMGFLECFNTYYPEISHPIRLEAKKVFNG